MRVWVVAVIAIAGCGRVGFDPMVSCAQGVCCGSGGCAPSCEVNDPSCLGTCGDGRCDGSQGESCATCAADCAVMAATCGNGLCDGAETAATCSIDCGPASWPWTGEETTLLALVNQERATPLMADAGPVPVVHAWAWSEATRNLAPVTGTLCNGGTLDVLITKLENAGYPQSLSLAGPATVQDAFNYWMNDPGAGPVLVGNYTSTAIGVAHGDVDTYVMVLK